MLITGNGGPDLHLFIKAARDARLDMDCFTLNAHAIGVASSIRDAGVNRIRQVMTWHENIADDRLSAMAAAYRKRCDEGFRYQIARTEIDMLAKVIDLAQSADPLAVAHALEGMHHGSDSGEVWMRPDDHQHMQPLYVATYVKAGRDAPHDVEGTGYGWRTDARFDADDTILPTTCRMERP